MIINLLAEGYMEEIVAERLIPFCNHEIGFVYGKKGCDYIREKATAFRHLATHETGLLILTDFCDTKLECVTKALQLYVYDRLPSPPKTFLFRFAVNELESWLLADRKKLAEFLGISIAKMPLKPECEPNPKQTLVNLARHSKKKRIREGIAPPQGHHAEVGPDYTNLMKEFILRHWDIENASRFAPSLARCIYHLREISSN